MKARFLLLVSVAVSLCAAAPPDADQVVVPARMIKGSSTGLLWPSGLAVDQSGTLFVANDGDLATGGQDSLTVYAPNANGDAKPLRTIAGPLTGLTRPNGVAVDASGALYVANTGVSGSGESVVGQDRVLIFAPGASGDVAPVRFIKDAVIRPRGVALDGRGFIYISNYGAMVDAENSVTVYKMGASADPAPVRRIAGSRTTLDTPLALTVGLHGDIFVVNSGRVNMGIDSIIIFAPGASGNAAPARVITGDKTLLNVPQSVSVDPAGYIYVTNFGNSTISVYAPNANGNAAPVQLIGGPDAALGAYVEGTAFGNNGDYYVVNRPQLPNSDFSWICVFSRATLGAKAP
ncbi:MAG: hypothetical protein JO219_08890 [Candidatus Eremiobacteraeota bacterium]|nr:hypothetical protein [Candidatus Eremiobacteraeota bacterium]MBV8365585.1 hypothetical protein [Candidatus Eremiobacteraeota bacterium]